MNELPETTDLDLHCPTCDASWGKVCVHWGQPTQADHFTRADGSKPDPDGSPADEKCPSCDLPMNVMEIALGRAWDYRDEFIKSKTATKQ